MKTIFILILLFISCDSDSPKNEASRNDNETKTVLTEYDRKVISYFKEISLGFEFGSASKVTRKWVSNINIFLSGNPTIDHKNELNIIISELNTLVNEAISLKIVDKESDSNFFLFIGKGSDYAQINTSAASDVGANYGLFYVWWNSNQEINKASMYVDNVRPTTLAQKHL